MRTKVIVKRKTVQAVIHRSTETFQGIIIAPPSIRISRTQLIRSALLCAASFILRSPSSARGTSGFLSDSISSTPTPSHSSWSRARSLPMLDASKS